MDKDLSWTHAPNSPIPQNVAYKVTLGRASEELATHVVVFSITIKELWAHTIHRMAHDPAAGVSAAGVSAAGRLAAALSLG